MVYLVFPLEEVLEVEGVLEELSLVEVVPSLLAMEQRLWSFPSLLLDLTGATTLGSTLTMTSRRGDVVGLEEVEDLEVIAKIKKVVESEERKSRKYF